MVAAICLVAFSCSSAPLSQDSKAPSTDSKSEQPIGGDEEKEAASTAPLELIICHPKGVGDYVFRAASSSAASSEIVCSVFERSGVVALLERHVSGTEYPSLTAALSHQHVDGTVEYIYFYADSALKALSDQDRQVLAQAFEAGAVVGVGATDGAAMVSSLGLKAAHVAPTLGGLSSHFLHRTAGSTEHFVVDLANLSSFGELLGQMMDWEERNHQRSGSTGPSARTPGTPSPRLASLGAPASGLAGVPWVVLPATTSASVGNGWNYCKSYEYSGTVKNDDNNAAGGYNMKYSFYYLNKSDVDDGYNRWLVVGELISSMSKYYTNDSNKKKGWYMRSMGLNVELSEYLGDIIEWSPSTSVGSSSSSSTIGAGISASGPDVSYSVTTNNSTADVSIKVDGDLTNNDGVNGRDWVSWNVEFAACGTNSSDTKLKDPAAAAQGLWSEEFAFYTANKDDNEGIKVYLKPKFQVQHCRCGDTHCPIRNTSTTYLWGGSDDPGQVFQVFADTCK